MAVVDDVRALTTRLDALRRTVRQAEGAQVRKKTDRDEARACVDQYFRELREPLVIAGVDRDAIQVVDFGMHALLDASNRLSSKQTYVDCIKSLVGALREVERKALAPTQQGQPMQLEPTDERIVTTLSRILPSAARSYEQALRDLLQEERLSWRGPAVDLREALRETLDHLAPDDDVEAEPGYKLERDSVGPTMKQKVRFILKKRGVPRNASLAPEAAASAVDEMIGAFVRSVYTRSSISTHTPTERDEVLKIHGYVRAALTELLEVHRGA